MSAGRGTRVTARDLDTGDSDFKDIKDDYCLTVDGDCEVSGIVAYPTTGTHVITVRHVGGKRVRV